MNVSINERNVSRFSSDPLTCFIRSFGIFIFSPVKNLAAICDSTFSPASISRFASIIHDKLCLTIQIYSKIEHIWSSYSFFKYEVCYKKQPELC